jgi:hypothetical protein
MQYGSGSLTFPLSRSLSRGTVSLAAIYHGTLKLEVGNNKGDLETQTWEFSLLKRAPKY